MKELKGKLQIVSFIGCSNSGKTTLIAKLIKEFASRGIKTGVIKHSNIRDFQVDVEGKDTWRYAQAGAVGVAMVISGKVFILKKTSNEVPLKEIVNFFSGDVDFILAEGYKQAEIPKVEVIRPEVDRGVLDTITGRIAVVSDSPPEELSGVPEVPFFRLEDVKELADFLLGE
ncbi:MAG: molybdopterin-guanine dinucleotide biosynthesis protein B [Spirochaetes bacterium]|nr:MAG: molybdopterin-guanine dinucleotide biosynthesis protein B [Spirochaetota bacterium]